MNTYMEPATGPAECAACGWKGDAIDVECAIADFGDRVAPGEICPAGECPECGALAHLIEKPDPAPELLAALKALRTELRAHVKLDVKRHYSLMVADAAAGTAIAKAEA